MTGTTQSRTVKVSLTAVLAFVVCPLLIPTAKADSWFSNPQHAATAKTVDGDVSVLRGQEKWALDAGGKVQAKEVIVTGRDGRALFEVSDGSSFRVFPNSKVIFRNNSGNLRDLLDVMLGRVRVQIQHEPNKTNPNNIRTPSAVISVRGTEFDIEVSETETTVVEVTEGIVAVRHALLGGEKELRQGDKITVYRNTAIAKSRGGAVMQVVRMALDVVVAGANGPGAGGSGGGIGGGTIGGGGIGGVGGVGDTNTGGPGVPTPPSIPGTTLPIPPSLPTPPGLPGGGVIP